MKANLIQLQYDSPFEEYDYAIRTIGEHFKNCGADSEQINQFVNDKDFYSNSAIAIAKMIDNGFSLYILEYEREREYAGIMYLLENTNEKEITSIYVDEKHRRKGLASEMVSFAISKGCKTISTFGEENIEIFKRLGFEINGKTITAGSKEYSCMYYTGKEELK